MIGDEAEDDVYIVISGRAPSLKVQFKPAGALPSGQRAAYYALAQAELDGSVELGSIFTVGDGARHG